MLVLPHTENITSSSPNLDIGVHDLFARYIILSDLPIRANGSRRLSNLLRSTIPQMKISVYWMIGENHRTDQEAAICPWRLQDTIDYRALLALIDSLSHLHLC